MAAPLFEVRNLVKLHGITLFSANFELYGDMSERIVLLLQEITPLIEVYSVDECFLDLSELNIADLHTWAKNVQKRVQTELGLPVSIGIGPTKTLAKVGTNHAKKHGGITVIDSDEKRKAVLENLPVADVWGIGWRTAPKLTERGVTNAWQLVTASDAWLKRYFNITGMRMVEELRGLGCLTFGDKHDKRQSIMVSRAFGHKVRRYHQLESAAASFATRAAARLRAQGSVCTAVAVYLTTSKQDEKTRSVSRTKRLAEATADTGKIIATAVDLLGELYDHDFSYQKVSVLLLEITDKAAWQMSLTEPVVNRDKKVELMADIDAINKRYGLGTIWHAAEDKKHVGWQSKQALLSPSYTTRWSGLPRVKG